MDYTLHKNVSQVSARREGRGRIIPPRRTENLRAGGGRKNSPGWTEQKRKSNRLRLDALRPFIKTAVTIWYPSRATSAQLSALNECHRNFCKERRLSARCVWEGPGFHQHIALGIAHDPAIEQKWKARLTKRWLEFFEQEMPADAYLWKPQEEPDRIASYLSKTRKDGVQKVKAAFSWLTFSPVWETGFRGRCPVENKQPIVNESPRKKRVTCSPDQTPEKEGHTVSPRYTVETPEKESERQRHECPTCRRRWGRSLWEGSCKCSAAFPYV